MERPFRQSDNSIWKSNYADISTWNRKFNASMRSNSINNKTKHCKSFLQSWAQNFEPYKPDNAILRYQNQHARQLDLDFSSLTNWKDKNNNSDQSERHKLSSSEKRKHRTDRSDKNVIEPTFPISERNISIINYNPVSHSTTKIRGQDLMRPLVGLNETPGGT